MRIANVVLNLFSSFYIIMIMVYFSAHSGKKEVSARLYFLLCISTMLRLLTEALSWGTDRINTPVARILSVIGTFGLYFFGFLSLLIFSLYVYYYISKKCSYCKFFLYFPVIVSALEILMLIVSVFSGILYTISPENVYERGPLFLFSQVVAMVIIVFSLIPILLNRKHFTWLDIFSISAYMIFPVISIMFQVWFPQLSCTGAAMAIGVALVFFEYQADQISIGKSEAELERRSNMVKTQFVTSVSYEVRTPLSAILGYGELIKSREDLPEGLKSDIEHIVSAGNSLLEIVNNILDMAKVESGRFTLKEKVYSVSALLDEIERDVRMLKGSKPLKFRITVDNSVPDWLVGDSIMLKQIALNLLSNAVRYTDKGSVSMGLDYMDGKLVIKVRDTGIGLRPQDMETVFSRFERLDSEENDNFDGAGLGLPMTKELTQQMGGIITVDSTYGKGTTFKVIIPQKIGGQAEDEYNMNFKAPSAYILLVDDNEVSLHVTERLLGTYGIKADCVESGRNCLKMLNGRKYDLIMLDHLMPDMDGVQTMKRIRKMHIKTPTVAITANAMGGMKEYFLENGFDGFAVKPLSLDELGRQLIKWLPKDKIVYGETGAVNEIIPDNIKKLSGIDFEMALTYTGNYNNLLLAVRNFAGIINEKANAIEKYAVDNIDSYIIEVHSLKSSARMIGATELSILAQQLESAGKERDIEKINKKTPELLSIYRSYTDKLEPVLKDIPEKTVNIDHKKLSQEVSHLIEALQDYDLDFADGWAEKAACYKVKDDVGEMMERIFSAIRLINYEEAIGSSRKLLEYLK